jgi:hypothetical protein
MKLQTLTAAALVALAALAVPAATVSDADARVRRAQGSVTTNRGTYNGNAEVRRSRGARDRSATVTGPNGGSRSVEDSRNWGEGAYTHDRTTTFNDGSQRHVESEVLRTGEGTFSGTREVTGRNGETRTQTGDFSVERGENGRVVTGAINTTNGGQIDYAREFTRGDGVRSVDATATFEDGSSISRSSDRTRTENGATFSNDVTFRDGSTRSVDTIRTGNGDGTGVIDRTVTRRNGNTRTQTGAYEVTRTP